MPRINYLLLIAATIIIGLATRKTPQLFPLFIVQYGGDTLWAMLFFLLFRFIWFRKPLYQIAIITYTFATIIEVVQLYQAPWLNNLRQTFFGQMVLGQGFLWSDLVCYAAGAGMGWLAALLLERKTI